MNPISLPRRFELFEPPPRAIYDRVEGHWSGDASTYAAYNYLSDGAVSHVKSAHFEVALRETRRWFGTGRVIDFGSADGVFVPSLARHFAEVLAIDVRPEFVDLAQTVADECGLRNVRTLCNAGVGMDELVEQLGSGHDVVFLLETLEHIAEQPDLFGSRARFVEQLLGLVAADGVVVVSVPTMVGPAFLIQRATLAALRLNREPITARELFEAGVLRRTGSLEPRWTSEDHLGFNHLELERAFRDRGLPILRHRNLFFSQLYVVGRPR